MCGRSLRRPRTSCGRSVSTDLPTSRGIGRTGIPSSRAPCSNRASPGSERQNRILCQRSGSRPFNRWSRACSVPPNSKLSMKWTTLCTTLPPLTDPATRQGLCPTLPRPLTSSAMICHKSLAREGRWLCRCVVPSLTTTRVGHAALRRDPRPAQEEKPYCASVNDLFLDRQRFPKSIRLFNDLHTILEWRSSCWPLSWLDICGRWTFY
jgi:hypothetical protein